MTFTWQRQLSSLQTADNSLSYKYDSNGMRTQKTDNSGTTYYYYDSNKNLIGLTKGNDTLLFYYDSDGSATSFKYNGTMYYYIKNLQGDVVKIINQAGTEVAGYVYDAWGNIKSTTGNSILKDLNPFRYRSYVYDEESSLYYLQSRYYDSFTGRFLNADIYCDTQSGSPLSTNMFAYCENNVINLFDNYGNMAMTISVSVAATNWWNPVGWFAAAAAAIICVYILYNCVSLGIKAGKAVAQLSKSKKTKIPEKLKKNGKVKTPDKYKNEFTDKGKGIFEHKKTKWKCGKSKDGHYNGKPHWHYSPKNAKTGDYYNVSPEGKVI